MKPKVILDCDPGDDDALAIFVASRFADVVAITTVAGNAAVEDTTRNALRTVELLGLKVPVYKGCGAPLSGTPVERPRGLHGASGFGDRPQPEPALHPAAMHAVDAILDIIRQDANVTIVATGPLTNLATAFRRAPDLAERLRRLVIMGGSVDIGNRSPVAEANIWADPEAAAVVMESAVPKTLIGLHVTRQVVVEPENVAVIRHLPGPIPAFYGHLLQQTLDAYERLTGLAARPLHDPCAVLALTHPHLFGFEQYPVKVELEGRYTRGMTVIDRRPSKREPDPGYVQVAMRVDASSCRQLVLDALKDAAEA